MLIYIVVFFLIVIYSLYPYQKHNSQKSKKIFLILSFMTMALVLGLRGRNVGEDTGHYLDVFKYSANVKWIDMLHSKGMRTGYFTDEFGYTDTIENGFLALAKIVHIFTDNGQVFIFLVSAVTCALFAKFIYDNCKKDVVFPTFIFLCESMFMLAFNGARQVLATAIAIQAYKLLNDKKWKKAIATIIIAALIHNVALVCFALFPITLIKPKKEFRTFKYAIIAAIASPFIIILGQTVVIKIFPRYAAYFSTNFWANSVGGTAILWIIEFGLILVNYWKKFKNKDLFQTSCLILIYLACELMGLRITMFSRVGWFFRAYLILFFPICRLHFNRRTWKVIKTIIFILLLLLYFSYASSSARKYLFFWQ